jgi:DNA-3-methyladenine glycosylase II
MSMRRFRVEESSMLPTLAPGEEIVATDARPARVGELVVFPHPARDDFWLVKRRVRAPVPLETGQAWALSDNRQVASVDSRTFGPVPLDRMMPVVTRLDHDTFAEASTFLAGEDDSLAGILSTHGLPDFWSRPPGFPTLTLLILEQQVSLESGAAVYRRLVTAAGGSGPGHIHGLGVDGVRACGVTRQKTGYILDLAAAVLGGDLDLPGLDTVTEGQARAALLGIRGVGEWTADAYLLSAQRRPDVFPVGDRALQVGMAETLGLDTIPDSEQLLFLAEPWRPMRAVAARLVWHSYLSRRGRSEPEHALP